MSTISNGTSMKGLTSDMVANLMANTRTKNAYGPPLVEFCESDEAAINPVEVWPALFSGKKASTLYQGFRNAAEKADLTDTILVKMTDDTVFLLHKERVTILLTPTDEADSNDANSN